MVARIEYTNEKGERRFVEAKVDDYTFLLATEKDPVIRLIAECSEFSGPYQVVDAL